LTPSTHSQSRALCFPQQPAHGHAGVVEHEVRRAEALQRGRGQRFDVGGLADIAALRQHLGAQALDLVRGQLQRVGLHVGHHHLHAAARRDAAGFQPETRRRTGDDGDAALQKRVHHASLTWNPMRGKCTCTVPARSSRRRSTTSSALRPTSVPATGSLP
jgi:hypothetical protein